MATSRSNGNESRTNQDEGAIGNGQGAASVLLCYEPGSEEDRALLARLMEHLALLLREGKIRAWHDGMVVAGANYEAEVQKHLEEAQVILLLVSSSFVASDKCYERLAVRAMERRTAGEASVIPIVLRACDWRSAPFGALDPLPPGGTPIAQFEDVDVAFAEVAKGLRAALDAVSPAQPPASSSAAALRGKSPQSEGVPPAPAGTTLPASRTSRWRTQAVAAVLALTLLGAAGLVVQGLRDRDKGNSLQQALAVEASTAGSVVLASPNVPTAPTAATAAPSEPCVAPTSPSQTPTTNASAPVPAVPVAAQGLHPPKPKEAPSPVSSASASAAFSPRVAGSSAVPQGPQEGIHVGSVETRDESPVTVNTGTIGAIKTRDKSPVIIGGK